MNLVIHTKPTSAFNPLAAAFRGEREWHFPGIWKSRTRTVDADADSGHGQKQACSHGYHDDWGEYYSEHLPCQLCAI